MEKTCAAKKNRTTDRNAGRKRKEKGKKEKTRGKYSEQKGAL